MIIECINCNKVFEVSSELIPENGRTIQCGSCNHVWFYITEEEKNETLHLTDEIKNKEPEIENKNKENKITEKEQSLERNKTKIKNEKILNKQKNNNVSKGRKNEGSKIFAYFLVFIISFTALLILLDTFKTPLINIFPKLEILLFNLFETLQDIKLFIIDLI